MKTSHMALAFALFAGTIMAQNSTENFPKTSEIHAQAGGTYDIVPIAYQFSDFSDKIDAKTMYTHYAKHYVAYTNNLNKALEERKINQKDIKKLILSLDPKDAYLRNNAGGYYNHSLYFESFSQTPNQNLSPELAAAMQKSFGGFDKFMDQFQSTASNFFGSGWAWLILDENKNLKIITTANQDSPQMQHINPKYQPMVALDVWEHAYYLKYLNKKSDYVKAFVQLLDWQKISFDYKKALAN